MCCTLARVAVEYVLLPSVFTLVAACSARAWQRIIALSHISAASAVALVHASSRTRIRTPVVTVQDQHTLLCKTALTSCNNHERPRDPDDGADAARGRGAAGTAGPDYNLRPRRCYCDVRRRQVRGPPEPRAGVPGAPRCVWALRRRRPRQRPQIASTNIASTPSPRRESTTHRSRWPP